MENLVILIKKFFNDSWIFVRIKGVGLHNYFFLIYTYIHTIFIHTYKMTKIMDIVVSYSDIIPWSFSYTGEER